MTVVCMAMATYEDCMLEPQYVYRRTAILKPDYARSSEEDERMEAYGRL